MNTLAVSESLWQRIGTLPCSTNITEAELSKVVMAVKKAVRNHLTAFKRQQEIK